MEKTGYIEITISGSKGNQKLKPESYDIKEIIPILENVENLLYPGDKKDRPTISYKIEEGSVRHIFKTSIQSIIGFSAILEQVNMQNSIDFLDINTAKAFESFQEIAIGKDYRLKIKTSMENSSEIEINNSTNFYRTEAVWADAEFYFYGKITNAGGKNKANVHLVTEEYGTIFINTPISFLENYNENLLYKKFGVRAVGKQNSETGEIDTSSLVFKELIDYDPIYDENYLDSLIEKASISWKVVKDKDKWLNEIRGGYES